MRATCSQHRGQGLGGGYLVPKLITESNSWLGLGQGGAENPAFVLDAVKMLPPAHQVSVHLGSEAS